MYPMYTRVKEALSPSPHLLEKLDPAWFEGPPHMIICGSGHIARALCRIAVMVDFRVTVFDCKEEYLDPSAFPAGIRLLHDNYENLHHYLPEKYFGVITMGHDGDSVGCLRCMLDSGTEYVGVLASRRLSGALKQQMLAEGYSSEQVERIYSPVGLKISGITPNEIAISILAEIIQIKNAGRRPAIISEELLQQTSPGCLCVITDQEGHVPRARGSMMFVTRNRIFDSVGGSLTERTAIEKARTCTIPFLQTFPHGGTGNHVEILFIPMW